MNQGGNKRKADEFVANTNAQGGNQRRKGRQPPRSGGSGPTLEQLLNEPCPKHGTQEKPATHLWKDCTIMKAFKNSNAFDGVTTQVAAQVEAAFRARAPVQAEEIFMVRVILVTREVIISNTTKGINSSNNPAIRATRSSLAVDSITCSQLVCANETKSFTRGLLMLSSRQFHAIYGGLSSP